MGNKLPLGYWLKECQEKYLRIGFQYGGHMGGECEIFLPKEMLDRFNSDTVWRNKTVNRFYRIIYLATPDMNVPIPESEKAKDGIVPDDWL